ncbi:hypothetical protein [Methanobrevibacter sp.]|uniref:hypothetical protein n=1 Tax=Methanobrevibacter sp. TaxID=66852 RepID=UPI00386C0BDD
MEQWKISILTGIALIILAAIFAVMRGHLSIWLIIVIVLGVIDIILGIIRKNR